MDTLNLTLTEREAQFLEWVRWSTSVFYQAMTGDESLLVGPLRKRGLMAKIDPAWGGEFVCTDAGKEALSRHSSEYGTIPPRAKGGTR